MRFTDSQGVRARGAGELVLREPSLGSGSPGACLCRFPQAEAGRGSGAA